MLEKVKVSLRIKNNAYDDEIIDLIESAKLDLGISGISNTSDMDDLVRHAIILYCKAYFGSDENSQQFLKSYESLKIHMSLATGYRTEVTE